MPFPSLTLRSDARRPERVSLLWAEAEGVPDNGPNLIALPFLAAGVPADEIDEDWLVIDVVPLSSPSTILGATYVAGSLAANQKAAMSIDFTQAGVDSCRVTVQVLHTLSS